MKINKYSFDSLCEHLILLEKISSRNQITEVISNLLKEIPQEYVEEFMYLINGRVAPFYVKSDFNIGDKMITDVLSEVLLLDNAQVVSYLNEYGDLGTVFYNNKKGDIQNYEFIDIFNFLKEISLIEGKDSNKIKRDRLIEMLKTLSPNSGKYLIRIVLGKLRLGFSNKTLLDAISYSIKGDKSLRKPLESAYSRCSDIGIVAKYAFLDINSLNDFSIKIGIPIFPKLVERSSSINDGIKRFKEVYAQPKFDGLRCQIHILDSGEIKLFSRNLNDITDLFPQFIESFQKLNVKNAIFDSEIIGINLITNKFLLFQDTVKMKRKNNLIVDDNNEMKAFIFDVIYLNSKSFLNEPFKNRIMVLSGLFSDNNYKNIELTETKIFSKEEDVYDYFEENINKGLEGVVLKNPNSLYTPGTRNFDWLKLKRDSLKDVVDTIDAVIMGYYKGSGSRAKLGIGGVLVGIYNSNKNKFETICKLGSGFSEEELVDLKASLDLNIINNPDKFYVFNKDITPDVWVDPKIVVVIRSDEITKSPIHTSGMDQDKDKKGFALRFPRFISFRVDKGAYDSTSVSEVESMYKIEKNI